MCKPYCDLIMEELDRLTLPCVLHTRASRPMAVRCSTSTSPRGARLTPHRVISFVLLGLVRVTPFPLASSNVAECITSQSERIRAQPAATSTAPARSIFRRKSNNNPRRTAQRRTRFRRSSTAATCWVSSTWTVSLARNRAGCICDSKIDHVCPSPRTRASSPLSMKVKSRRGSSKEQSATSGPRSPKKALYIQVGDLASDSWRLGEAAEILKLGGVGVIPTDTCYTFACDILSRKGLERILQIKSQWGRKKPLSLLCKDISTMSIYANGIDKALFKIMKAALPGPFTFILPSNNQVPRMLLDHKHHKKTWKRREIGVRIPDAPVLMELLHQLDGPLLCSSVPSNVPTDDSESDYPEDEQDDQPEWDEHDEGPDHETGGGGRRLGGEWGDDALVSGDPSAIERTWGHAVDFIVDAGLLEVGGFSTVVDALGSEPVVLREGLGDPALIVG